MRPDTILSSWYPLTRSVDLKKGCTYTLELLEHPVVLFRTAGNKVGALKRQCPHMGGDLSRGKVTDTGLVCPIHHWEFAPDGQQIRTTGREGNSDSNCQHSLPCLERWGLVFVFLGKEPYFEFPDVSVPVYCATPTVQDMDMHYTVPSLFGFDTEHFYTVHHRNLSEMTLYRNQPGHIGTRLIASVGDSRWSDRLMQRLGINEVETDVDYWAGNIVFGRHHKTRTHALITTLPLTEHQARVFFVAFQEKPKGGWLQRLAGWCRFQVAKPLIGAFVRQDEVALNGVRFDPATSKHRKDNEIEQWLEHVKQLPFIATKDLLN